MAKDRIKLLHTKVANQIAAGEVVAHPSSVVKEMMENSIDAGATEVIVNFRKAGYELIQIVDNGVGMTPNDARMAFERHATSKIKSAQDIYALTTFGFRGEALASIAAVAKIELKSRPQGANMGTLTILDGGTCVEQRPEMCEEGSQFFVRDIFQDSPARRRFLEKDSKSTNQILREFRRVALCYPRISFELYNDGAPTYRLAPTSLASRIVEVVGKSAKSSLLEVNAKTTIVNIHGYIGNEKSARSRNNDQYLFVNGRYFESKYLVSAILRGYEKIIKAPLQPSFFLYFEVTPDNVDVNIHPQKTEIKFAEESSIWTILLATIRETLARTGVISLMDFDESSNIEIPVVEQGKVYEVPRAISNENYNPFEVEIETKIPMDEMDAAPAFTPIADQESSDMEFETFESYQAPQPIAAKPKRTAQPRKSVGGAMTLSENIDRSWEDGFDEVESIANTTTTQQYPELEEFESTRYDIIEEVPQAVTELPLEKPSTINSDSMELNNIAVTNGRYAWCKMGTNMSVIDLKRAKERVLYEYYCQTISSGECVSQRTFFPLIEQLGTEDFATLSENIAEFEQSGFEIELMDDCNVKILAMPAGVKDIAAMDLINEILLLIGSPEDVAESRREKIAMVMSRNGSKSLGRSISPQQARELITQLLNCKMSGMTADGRRVIWEVTADDIKRRMK